MLIDRDCLNVCGTGVDESVTDKTKLEVPAIAGVPEIVPADRESPIGKLPELRPQV